MKDDDLVTLGEAERELGIKPRVLRAIDERRRNGAVTGMPEPAVVGRTARLWSLSELSAWWEERVDGRSLRHENRANVSDNT